MKKGIILNLKQFKLLNYVNLNKILLMLAAFFIVGIILGSTWLSREGWLTGFSKSIFNDFILLHTNEGFLSRFFSCFLRYSVNLFLYFLAGTAMLGVAITPFITIWQGILIGNITSFIYSQYGIGGIAFNAIILVAPLSAFILCCLLAAKKSIEFSLSIAKLTLPKFRPASLHIAFKNYCINYLIYIGIAAICTLIEIILNVLFLKFFNF